MTTVTTDVDWMVTGSGTNPADAADFSGTLSAHAWTDPRIVGDADGSGLLSAADAFLIVQEGLGLSEPFVPDNPHITITPAGGGVDPQFQIGAAIPAFVGGWVTVPIQLVVEPAATNVGGIDFDLLFDPSQLTIDAPVGVSAGADTAGSWAVSSTLVTAGHLRVGMVNSRGQPLTPGLREIVRLLFQVEVGGVGLRPVQVGPEPQAIWDGSETHPTRLDIEPVDPHAGGYVWTAADGSLLIGPAPPALVISEILQNLANPWDVDGDGAVTPVDVLVVVNFLNSQPGDSRLPSASVIPAYAYDVNNDQACTALDVLAVINALNRRSVAEGEDFAHGVHGCRTIASQSFLPGLRDETRSRTNWTRAVDRVLTGSFCQSDFGQAVKDGLNLAQEYLAGSVAAGV